MPTGTLDLEEARPAAAYAGQGDLLAPREVGGRVAGRLARDSGGIACVDDLAAVDTRIGAYVHDVVGGAHHLLIVLDDDHRIPQVT